MDRETRALVAKIAIAAPVVLILGVMFLGGSGSEPPPGFGGSSGSPFAWLFGGGIVGFLIVAVIALFWLLLPFAIYGTKKRLDQLIEEMQKTNAQLGNIQKHMTGED